MPKPAKPSSSVIEMAVTMRTKPWFVFLLRDRETATIQSSSSMTDFVRNVDV
jgi:hypothetical protein